MDCESKLGAVKLDLPFCVGARKERENYWFIPSKSNGQLRSEKAYAGKLFQSKIPMLCWEYTIPSKHLLNSTSIFLKKKKKTQPQSLSLSLLVKLRFQRHHPTLPLTLSLEFSFSFPSNQSIKTYIIPKY